MAKLPTSYSLGTVQPGAPRPPALVNPNAANAVGQAMQGFGQSLSDIGLKIQDEEDTAAAKERDAFVSDEIRKLLHDPQSGFTAMYGKNAVSARQQAFDRLKQIRELATKGLSKGAQRKIEARLASRIDSAEQTIDRHSGNQRRVWLDGASSARIAAAEQDALAGAVDSAYEVISEEIRQKGRREGWDKAKLDVELSRARSSLVYNQAVKMADSDPEFALDYITKNKSGLTPEDYLKIKGTLEPLAKQAKGRRIGAEAALVGVSSDYLANIRRAESGGNDTAANPNSSAVGRYQFLKGTWADLMAKHPELGLTADGRTSGVQNEIAIRAFTADNATALSAAGIALTGGNLYAAHFLGAGGAVKVLAASQDAAIADLVGADVIAANPFLSGMTVGDFRKWATAKGGGGVAYSAAATGDINQLLAINDPVERKAALEEYNLRMKVQEGQRKQQLSAATNEAFKFIEAGNAPDDLPLDVKQALGMEAMSKLRTYHGKVAAGESVETDPASYIELKQMQANDPDGFRSVNMMEYVDVLSQSDFKSMVDAQNKPVDMETRAAASTLMTVAKRQMEAAGIDTTPKAGSDEAAMTAAMQARLLKWQERFVSENKRAPTQAEIDERIGQELLPVVMDPPGILNRGNGFVFDAPDVAPEKLAETGITIGEIEVPAEVVAEQIAIMQADGEDVTSDALVQRLADLMEGR